MLITAFLRISLYLIAAGFVLGLVACAALAAQIRSYALAALALIVAIWAVGVLIWSAARVR